MQHKIVYLTHGTQKFHDQTAYSALTLLHLLLAAQRQDIGIFIYTDRPDLAPEHPLIRVIPLTADELQRYKGPLDYVHRIKLEVLRRAEKEIGLPIIYVDCDTRWLKVPAEQVELLARPSAAGERRICYMYQLDGMVSDTFYPHYSRILPTQRHRLEQWQVQSTPPWPMWNSGTVGVPVGADGFFDKALTINDGLLPYVRPRNFTEQLALALVAVHNFEVRAFDDCLDHYWNFSYELPVFLRRFFESLPPGLSAEALAEKCYAQPIVEAELRKIQSAPSNRFMRWRKKMRNSLYKRKIDIRALWLRLKS